jgi:hypothetical protein
LAVGNSVLDLDSDSLRGYRLQGYSDCQCQCNGKESPSYGGWRSDMESKGLSLFRNTVLARKW